MGTKYIDGDLHVKGKLWQNEEEVNVLFVDGNAVDLNNNAVIITSMSGEKIAIINIVREITIWGLANAKKFVNSLSVGIDLRTYSIDNLQLTDAQLTEFVKQTTEQNLMTFEIPAEGGTSRLKEITVTKGNKSIIFNDMTEINIPSVALNTTLNTESITVGSDTLKVMTTDTDQTISGTKTFDSNPIIYGISNSDKSDSIAYFNHYSEEGSSVISTGHFIAYGDDDSSNTLKPTTEYVQAEGGDVDAYYFSTGITLFDANGQVESVKLSYPAKSGTFALTNDLLQVDTDFSLTSTNPLQNKIISERLNNIDATIADLKEYVDNSISQAITNVLTKEF